MRRARWLPLLCVVASCTPRREEAPPPTAVVEPFLGDELPPLDQQGLPASGGTLRVAIEAEPPALSPLLDPLDFWGRKIGELVYSSLAAPNPLTWVPEPRLAERWELSPDNRVITFFLRKDVRWHDGHPFTARDVLFTFEKLRDPASNTAAYRSYLGALERFERVDDYTVRFHSSEAHWMAFDAIAEVFIYPAHIYGDGDFNTHPANGRPIGTGPFRFARWDAGEQIVLERWPHYFGNAARLDTLRFVLVPDPAVRLRMLEAADLDVVERLPPELWLRAAESGWAQERFWRLRHVPTSLQWIGWNQAKPYFRDARVRRALTMLLDRDEIVRDLRSGLDAPASSWFYPGSDEYNAQLAPLSYDPGGAATLLKQAGWVDDDLDGVRERDGVPFAFTFVYPSSNPFYESLAGLMQTELRRVGIKMDTARLEWAAFMERLRRHDFDACSLLWQVSPRNDPYPVWHSSAIEGGSNFVAFANPEADRLLEEARHTFDPAARRRLYARFSAVLHEQQPYTMLFHRYNLSLVSKAYGGVFSTPYGIFRYDQMYRRQP